MHLCFEVEPPRASYYCISPNSHTLVILLQNNPTSGDELEIVYEGYYEIKNTFIITLSLIHGVGHYHWLQSLIHQLPPSNKADNLICIIRRILNFS